MNAERPVTKLVQINHDINFSSQDMELDFCLFKADVLKVSLINPQFSS